MAQPPLLFWTIARNGQRGIQNFQDKNQTNVIYYQGKDGKEKGNALLGEAAPAEVETAVGKDSPCFIPPISYCAILSKAKEFQVAKLCQQKLKECLWISTMTVIITGNAKVYTALTLMNAK